MTTTTLLKLAVIVLSLVLVWCIDALASKLRDRSEQRTQARRATLREKAYKDMNQRWAMRKARQQLWDSVRK
ncbi:MAG: hypothetical protein IJ170_07255 [Ruminococcus sp.]|nr:hypothetical protein [Ruminococcus sp.]